MAEYLRIGHMEPVESSEGRECCYLPHHAVFKASDSGGKVRVVFNAAFRTTSEASLNDMLLPGPKLQPDLWVILAKWRLQRYGFMADIVKMFRQIKVHAEDTELQRILWRSDSARPVTDFRLTTVTYGTAPAPYLAIKTLLQLADYGRAEFPLGAAALQEYTYVDDILAGAAILEEAVKTREQTQQLLASAGFELDKWAASHPVLCPGALSADRLIPSDCVGALGVLWAPSEDALRLRAVPTLSSEKEPTKRSVLSDVARLFDPAGWAGPVFITAKIFLQDFWLAGIQWDDALPETLNKRWQRYAATLAGLNQVALPR